MRIKTSQDRVTELMLMFARLVEANNIADRYDINRIAENILIPLFRIAFGYEHIRNLNYTEHTNYPGIDLADDQARTAFQITASADNGKIKDTLQKFMRHELYKRYDRLVIYVLTKKQRSYSDKQYAAIINDRINFDKTKDIWDYTEVVKKASTFSQPQDVRKIQELLEENFGHGRPFPWLVKQELTEYLFLNLVEMFAPDKIFLAELSIDREDTIKNSFGTEQPLKWNSSAREVAATYLRQHGLRFSTEWTCHENKLLTFHDLHDEKLPLRALVDVGTISCEEAKRFYEVDGTIDEDRERVFKSLLGRCLQTLLYHCGVQWQHKEKLFIFTENGPTPCEQEGEYVVRKDTWVGEKESTRTVFWRKMKTEKPDEIFYCKHLAFETRYHQWEASGISK
jgi:hypothetical protein